MTAQRRPQGRPSKLTDHQRAEIGRRLALGESQVKLAQEFRVSRATISAWFSGRSEMIRNLAESIAADEVTLQTLPVSERLSVRTLADQMKAIQGSYAQAAADGAATAQILNGIAHRKARRLADDAESEDLRPIAALSETAKSAASLATNLINRGKPEAEEHGISVVRASAADEKL